MTFSNYSMQKKIYTICIILLVGVLLFALSTNNYQTSNIYQSSNIVPKTLDVFETTTHSETIFEWVLTNDISCHQQTAGDGLPRLGQNFTPPAKSIFIHETSCKGGLNSRQACAVESAARAHPHWQVNVLFSGPVPTNVLRESCLAKLLSYDNVQLLRLNLTDYARGTPVENLVATGPFAKSQWSVEHSSDVMRYLSLYKYGGVYMDSDVVVVRSFDELASNWAGRESSYAVDSGLMSFSRDDIGRKYAEATILDFKSKYDPKAWGNNGPGVITRVVKSMCSKNNSNWIKGCDGFIVYDPEVFYPVYYTDNKQYFEADRNLTTSNRTYVHHMWNALTRTYNIPSTSPYAQLAKQYCPKVYKMYGDKFGV